MRERGTKTFYIIYYIRNILKLLFIITFVNRLHYTDALISFMIVGVMEMSHQGGAEAETLLRSERGAVVMPGQRRKFNYNFYLIHCDQMSWLSLYDS